jgi:DNA helicase IV
MQLRMLARRSLSGSMTVVGDLAQATSPWTPKGWTDVLEHLAPRREPNYVELSVSYRTPAEVIEASAPVLIASGTGLTPPTPVRRSGIAPIIERVEPSLLASALADAARHAVELVAPGRSAIIAPNKMLGEVAEALEAAGIAFSNPEMGHGSLEEDLVILSAEESNGLEFDAAIVVEAAKIARGGQDSPNVRGLRTLYVTMTRPTKLLHVISTEAFPIS